MRWASAPATRAGRSQTALRVIALLSLLCSILVWLQALPCTTDRRASTVSAASLAADTAAALRATVCAIRTGRAPTARRVGLGLVERPARHVQLADGAAEAVLCLARCGWRFCGWWVVPWLINLCCGRRAPAILLHSLAARLRPSVSRAPLQRCSNSAIVDWQVCAWRARLADQVQCTLDVAEPCVNLLDLRMCSLSLQADRANVSRPCQFTLRCDGLTVCC